MKFLPLFVFLFFVSCADTIQVPCEELREGLGAADVAKVESLIGHLLEDLQPQVTSEDPDGHMQNLETFVDRLNAACNLNATIECYACIKTLPPQTHVRITLDPPNGFTPFRTLDILTSKDDIMKIINIHTF